MTYNYKRPSVSADGLLCNHIQRGTTVDDYTSKTVLRDYQREGVESIRAAYREGRRAVCYALSTGGGKTIIFSHIAEMSANKGTRILIVAHRRELVQQTSRSLDTLGISHGVIKAGQYPENAGVWVASAQTLVRRLDSDHRYDADLIIVDEAHHLVEGNTWGAIVDAYPQARLLGVTATPERLDGKGLGKGQGGYFDSLILGPAMRTLIDRGYLSDYVVYAPSSIDRSALHTRAGDFVVSEMDEMMRNKAIVGNAIDHYRKYANGLPAIAFCCTIAHAEQVAETFRLAGYRSQCLSANTPAAVRDYLIQALGAGEIDVLTNCQVVSEGTDIPVVGAAILLRPTQSLTMHLQMIGRVLRPYEGKQRAIILDHVGNTQALGLPCEEREWSLSGRAKKKRESDEDSGRVCDNCRAVFDRDLDACPECGWQVPKPEGPKIIEVAGELVEIDPRANVVDVSELHIRRRLREIQEKWGYRRGWHKHVMSDPDHVRIVLECDRRGYKPGWAYHQYQSLLESRRSAQVADSGEHGAEGEML